MKSYTNSLKYIPDRIRFSLEKYRYKESVCEIRLRKDAPTTLTTTKGNIFINAFGEECTESKAIKSSGVEISETLKKFCQGSVYRFLPTISEGFITNDEGYRLGICPESKNSLMYTIPEEISSLSIRIPRIINGASERIIDYFNKNGLSSTLIISLPGAGKTTVLRDLAKKLSNGAVSSPKRCVVIDERREIFPSYSINQKGICDVIQGYPKGKGIEIATRIFSPEIILCDEVSNKFDADGILENIGSGITMIATAHASDYENLLKKPFLKVLIENGAFETVCLIKKNCSEKYTSDFIFTKIS